MVKGIGRVGFEPTQHVATDLQSAATLQLRRHPIIYRQLFYFSSMNCHTNQLSLSLLCSEILLWLLFPAPTNGACQESYSISVWYHGVLTLLGHFTLIGFTALKHLCNTLSCTPRLSGNRGFWRLGFPPQFHFWFFNLDKGIANELIFTHFQGYSSATSIYPSVPFPLNKSPLFF